MPMPEKFVFVCINQRDPSHARPSCINNGSADVFNALCEEQGRRLLTNVKVVAGGCLEANVPPPGGTLDSPEDRPRRDEPRRRENQRTSSLIRRCSEVPADVQRPACTEAPLAPI